MIDLQDLNDLRICEKCNVVYMPQKKVDPTDYEGREYDVNPTICQRCDVDNIYGTKRKE